MAKATWLGTPDPYARLRKIETLDAERDAREICAIFYRDFLSLMLLPAFNGYMVANAIPRQSRILAATGELEHRTAKRFVDTAILGTAVLEHGIEKPGQGREAARRVNAMHTSYNIHPEDMVGFSVGQVIWAIEVAERYGWRRVTHKEREALRVQYAAQTHTFGGRESIPASLPELYAFWERYLPAQIAFEPQNLRLTTVMLDFLKSLFPAPIRPWIQSVLIAQVDPRIVIGCGLPVPGPKAKRISDAVFRLTGMRDPLPDDAPDLFSILVKKIYPNGYTLASLGTKKTAKDKLGFKDSPAEVASDEPKDAAQERSEA